MQTANLDDTPMKAKTPAVVRKRDGSTEPLEPNKVRKAISRCCHGLPDVDLDRVAGTTIRGLYNGVSTLELAQLSVQTAAALIAEEPQYGKLAARLLSEIITKEVRLQGASSFVESIRLGHSVGLVNDRLLRLAGEHGATLEAAICVENDREFEYFGLRTVYDRYLLRHPQTRQVIETPQQFFMRIACAVTDGVERAVQLYQACSRLEYMPSSPTLFNAGVQREQLSSCFLLDSPQDSLDSIYQKYWDIAKLSKYSGGIGVAFHRVRSRGSLIKGTNGLSNGIIPWLKTLDSSVSSVNQGGKRKGACCVYLETWHADIEKFLELRDNTGDPQTRTHNLNLANWVPDLFMERVEQDGSWSLFDPKCVPELPDLFGEDFRRAYLAAEDAGLAVKVVKARDLYASMLRTLAETGNGWFTFKDKSNLACNQTARPGRTVHLSNLCTEILEVTSDGETAVCNLGSVNLGRHMTPDGSFDYEKLAVTVELAVRQLDAVIDLNYYPVEKARVSNLKWRPVGLGLMGLQDVFFQMKVPFDSPEAREVSRRISETIYFHALKTSVALAREKGAHPAFQETRAAAGALQFDAWGVEPGGDWAALKGEIKAHGLRNSLLIAIAPTATIASIVGCYECIEPQISNLFKRETLSGDFMQVNRYLVADLKKLGLWTDAIRDLLKQSEGSIQGWENLPENLKAVYRTAWEIPMRSLIDMAADRGAFIDQGQSLNLFIENPNIGQLSSMYFYAWKKGLKTTYYLRSRPATRIAKTTIPVAAAVACSLENPESCEACQ